MGTDRHAERPELGERRRHAREAPAAHDRPMPWVQVRPRRVGSSGRAEMRRGKLVSSVMYRAGADELSYIISRFPNELQARLFPVMPFVELRRPSYLLHRSSFLESSNHADFYFWRCSSSAIDFPAMIYMYSF